MGRAMGVAAALFLLTCGSSAGTSIAPSITAGFTHTCAVTTDVRCWGDNRDGQLGDGTKTRRLTAVPVVGLPAGLVFSGQGAFHTCAIAGGGALFCWGNGPSGDGTNVNHTTPVAVEGHGSGVTSVATGYGFTCAVKDTGLHCWGGDFFGEVGDGNSMDRTARLHPVQVAGLSQGVESVAAGLNHACAVLTGGTVACWGWNADGEVGNEECVDWCATPMNVAGLTGVDSVAAGGFHTCALVGGAVKCWGANEDGELGDGTTKNRTHPAPVHGLAAGVRQIALGGLHSCALLDSGRVKCWGYNSFGQLGDGTKVDRKVPVTVHGLNGGVQQIVAGGEHTCALLANAQIRCWGGNSYGQLGNGKFTYNVDISILGRGTVTAPGLRCTQSCFTDYPPGKKLVVKARAAKGWKFARWGAACRGKKPRCTTKLTADKRIKAVFKHR